MGLTGLNAGLGRFGLAATTQAERNGWRLRQGNQKRSGVSTWPSRSYVLRRLCRTVQRYPLGLFGALLVVAVDPLTHQLTAAPRICLAASALEYSVLAQTMPPLDE